MHSDFIYVKLLMLVPTDWVNEYYCIGSELQNYFLEYSFSCGPSSLTYNGPRRV